MIDSKVLENAYEDWKAGTFIKTSTPRIDPSQVVNQSGLQDILDRIDRAEKECLEEEQGG